MNYEEFITEVTIELNKRIAPEIKLIPRETLKNNGIIWKGISFENRSRSGAMPTIYLEFFYENYKKGYNINQICDKIMEFYNALPDCPICESVFSFDKIKKQIVFKLINYETNTELLKNLPHIPYLDFAIVFYVALEPTSSGISTINITYNHLALWNITLYELYSLAKENTPKILPACLEPMDSFVAELNATLEPDDKLDDSDLLVNPSEMFIITNSFMNFGACCILYDGLLKEVGDKLQNNYFILPSSINEVIVCPEIHYHDTEWLQNMIREVNATELLPHEILSDHPYYYDRSTEALVLA